MTRLYHKRVNNQKWCPMCKQYKVIIEDFHHNKNHSDGYDTACKVCQARYYQEHREQLLPKHRISSLLSRERKKERLAKESQRI